MFRSVCAAGYGLAASQPHHVARRGEARRGEANMVTETSGTDLVTGCAVSAERDRIRWRGPPCGPNSTAIDAIVRNVGKRTYFGVACTDD
jgi:hypothetical protein